MGGGEFDGAKIVTPSRKEPSSGGRGYFEGKGRNVFHTSSRKLSLNLTNRGKGRRPKRTLEAKHG